MRSLSGGTTLEFALQSPYAMMALCTLLDDCSDGNDFGDNDDVDVLFFPSNMCGMTPRSSCCHYEGAVRIDLCATVVQTSPSQTALFLHLGR